jgi:hypothetical protein
MPYREIIAVCSQIHTKHINALCGPNVELLYVKLAVHIVTTVLLEGEELLFLKQCALCVFVRYYFQSDYSLHCCSKLHTPVTVSCPDILALIAMEHSNFTFSHFLT